jgi:uncharacterized protein CbrC (UPF0167 family)
MTARFQIFRAGSFTTWQDMCAEVAAFLGRVGRDNMIGLTQSEDNSEAVIVVWYWA